MCLFQCDCHATQHFYFRYPVNGEVSIVAGDFVMETWFYFLIGAIVLFKVIVIGGIIYIRKHNIFAKKSSALPNIYGTYQSDLRHS